MTNEQQNYRLKRRVFVWTVSSAVLIFVAYLFVLNSIQSKRTKQELSFQKDFQKLINFNSELPEVPKEADAPSIKVPREVELDYKSYQKAMRDLGLISKYFNSLDNNIRTEVERQDLLRLYKKQKQEVEKIFHKLNLSFQASQELAMTAVQKQNLFEKIVMLGFSTFFALLCFLMYRDLQRTFRAPVQALITGAEQIRAGNLDHLIDVKDASQDDFGQLMRNFNMMARRISSMTSRLEQANLSLQDQSDTFEESAKQKVKFIRQLGHELRAPLSSIIGFSEMLKEGYYGEVEEKQKDYLERIHRSGETLLLMVNDLVDQAKLQTGTWRLEFDRYDVHQLAEEVYLEFEIIAEKAGVTLLFDEKSVPEMRAIIDRKLIRQLMVNLITNALKFSEDGGEVTLSLKELTAKKAWRFSVIDTGVGIPENELDKIFDEFHQVQSAYSSKGAGLGLPLCKKIAEMHSGKITVKSTPGEGSTFNLIIPIDPQPKTEGVSYQSS